MRYEEYNENENLKVLGLLVRVKRNQMGYSLRDLAQLSNISHTLISNFELGKLIPNMQTIKEIMNVLELNFNSDPEISDEFNELFNKTFNHILFYEYDLARKIIVQIEEKSEIFENSIETINVAIIRCLFYAISNMFFEDFDRILAKYEVVLEFLSENQKQLFYFIKGLDYINKESYYNARQYLEKALSIGNKKIDLLIKEYYVITLSKANKYVDARIIATESIMVFEQQMNYVRAMRLRTRIAYDLYRINKFKESEKLYLEVHSFAKKYKVQDLMDRCNVRLSMICLVRNDNKKAEYYHNQVTPGYNRLWYYMHFDLTFAKGDNTKSLELYNKYINLDWVKNSIKTRLFFELLLMRYDEKYMDKKRFERNLLELIEVGHQSDDAEMIEVSCNMLSTFYKNERKYKLAYEISQILLHYNKNGIEKTIYDPNRIIKYYNE